MAFKLSAQLDSGGDPNLAFAFYASYITNNKWKFPESVIDVIEHPDWSGGSDSKAPYYSEQLALHIENIGTADAALTLTLRKHLYVEKPFVIEIRYKGLFSFDLPGNGNVSEAPNTWRYEQFLYYDAYRLTGIKDKMFTHQIEWLDGVVWSITARDIEVKWLG